MGLTQAMKNTTGGYITKRRRFIPTDIGGTCTAWYDFTDLSSMYKDDGSGGYAAIAANDNIAKIDNKAKDTATAPLANFMVQGTDSKRPQLLKDGKLNYHGSFVAADDNHVVATKLTAEGAIATNNLSNAVLDNDAFTLITVFKPAAATVSADEYIWRVHDASSSEIAIYVDNDTADTIQAYNANGGTRINRVLASGQPSTDAIQYWTYLANAGSTDTTADFYKNGVTSAGIGDGQGTAGDITLSADNVLNYMLIGGKAVNANFFNGVVYEIMVFDAVLSTSELRLMDKYLQTKYHL